MLKKLHPGKYEYIIIVLMTLLTVSSIWLVFFAPGPMAKQDNRVHIVYFYKTSCEYCNYTNAEFDRINTLAPGRLDITKYDISPPMSDETNQVYDYYVKKFSFATPGEVPWVIIENRTDLTGYYAIRDNLEGIITGSI